MLSPVTTADLLGTLETYYDAAPRATATTEEVGPFTLFLKTDPGSWDFYARPRIDHDAVFGVADVKAVRDRQRELDIAENLEWVHQTTPTLLDAARADGMAVEECPLLVLPRGTASPVPSSDDTRIDVLDPDSADLGAVLGAVHAGFAGTDDVEPRSIGRRAEQLRSGQLVLVGAYDGQGNVIGGGTHSPRGTTTELTGIAVLPRARRRGVGAAIAQALAEDARRRGLDTIFLSAQDDAVARVYERVGFVRVGTACIAEAPGSVTGIEVRRVDADAWEDWRDIRLRSLRDSPDAFGSTVEREMAFTEADWAGRLDGRGPAVLAYQADEPVALGAGWEYEPGKLMIVAMWTEPRVRGQGIGTRILDELVGWAQEHDLRPDLWVADANPAARRLYEIYGFVANGDTSPLREGSELTMSRLVLP